MSIFFTRIGLSLTEENKKQEPERQHSTMSLSKYQNQYPKSGSFQIKTNFTKKMIPKDGIIWNKPKRYPKRLPKIREHPKKTTQNNGTSPYHDVLKLPP